MILTNGDREGMKVLVVVVAVVFCRKLNDRPKIEVHSFYKCLLCHEGGTCFRYHRLSFVVFGSFILFIRFSVFDFHFWEGFLG